DREQLAGWLGFTSATRNSLDSVSDRDHVLELLSDAAIGMVHLAWELFNLQRDPLETHNLAADYVDKVKILSSAYEAFAKQTMVL
ncbi:hypothetical protein MJL81_29385, partial [Salmonella enterica subsp. enterica serovar Anatum]|nr:hypothetical protein [Salmonella enterica subsp. enterica serovar Anatum]